MPDEKADGGITPPTSRTRQRFALFAFVTAGATYALIIFGGIVRITGSGMACGDDWPLCNGRLIPAFDLPTLIEWGHRLAAALVGLLVLGLAVSAVRLRRTPELAGRGALGWALASAVLLIIQVLVGAITVRLELPTSAVVVHLAAGSALMATLLITGLRTAVGVEAPASHGGPTATYPRWAMLAAALGFLVLVLGGLVANTGAGPLCQGFPLCNGQLFPRGGGLVHLHWTHRALAFALLVLVAVATVVAVREGARRAVTGAAFVALGLVVAQIGIAAALVLWQLPASLRALHLAVGVALWGTLVVWAKLALTTHQITIGADAARPPQNSSDRDPAGDAADADLRTHA